MFVLFLVISCPGYLKVKSFFEKNKDNNNTISNNTAQLVRLIWFQFRSFR